MNRELSAMISFDAKTHNVTVLLRSAGNSLVAEGKCQLCSFAITKNSFCFHPIRYLIRIIYNIIFIFRYLQEHGKRNGCGYWF